MSELITYFNDFMCAIRPTVNQRKACQNEYAQVINLIEPDKTLKPIIVDIFLQGSYRRSTMIRPKGKKKPDVDIVLVSNLPEEKYSPDNAHDTLKPFLEKHYSKRYKPQGRSWGLHLDEIDLDLVITSAPSEVNLAFFKKESFKYATVEELFEEDDDSIKFQVEASSKWQLEPLRIPNRELKEWEDTDPLTQIQWTIQKNKKCGGNYVNVVKALKWWRVNQFPSQKYPKGYPLEHIIGICCPDDVTSIAKGVVLVTGNILETFKSDIQEKQTPILYDHGVKQNVLARLEFDDFYNFYVQVKDMHEIAEQAYSEQDTLKSAKLWYTIFGNPYPEPNGDKKGGFTPRDEKSKIHRRERFACM